MSDLLATLDNLKTSEMIVASGELSGSPIPSVLTPSAGGHKIAGKVLAKVLSLTNADIVALGNVATKQITVTTLPPKAFLTTILLHVTEGTASGVTSLMLDFGYDAGSGYTDYFNQHDLVNDQTGSVKTVGNSLSNGATIPCAAIPSVSAETPLILTLSTPTGAEKLKDVLTCGFDLYLETLVLPS